MRARLAIAALLLFACDTRRPVGDDGSTGDAGSRTDGGRTDVDAGPCTVCSDPPASVCTDTSTLRVYDSVGVCQSDRCAYGFSDRACPDCPNCNPCAGVVCNSPPGPCFVASGVCEGGTCRYSADDGARCDDGDTCTSNDTCNAGVCAGTPAPCDMPPAPICLDAITLRTYSSTGSCSASLCNYPFSDTTCVAGCSAGQCTGGTCTPIGWVSIPVDSLEQVGRFSSIGRDSLGGLHVTYFDFTNNDLKYAYRSPAGSWSTSTIDTTGTVGRDTSIAVDTSGGLHVSYRDVGAGDLKYAYRAPAGVWTPSTVDAAGTAGQYSSIAVDGAGGVHIAYHESSAGDLRYAYKPSGGAWELELIDATGDAGEFLSLALDAAGGAHVSYHDNVSDALRYAYRNPGTGEWANVLVESVIGHDIGESSSIAVDSTGGVHISYYAEETTFDLRYAYRAPGGGGWAISTVDDVGNTGLYSSIEIDGARGVHISYRNATDGDLMYAYRASGGTTWSTAIVDAVNDVGIETSLVLETNRTAHITYYDFTNFDLRYATGRLCP